MARFDVVLKLESVNHEIDQDASRPVQAEVIQVSRDPETGRTFLQSKFKNASQSQVTGFCAVFTVNYKNGESETWELKEPDVCMDPEAVLVGKPVRLPDSEVAGILVDVKAIELTDAGHATSFTVGFEDGGQPSQADLLERKYAQAAALEKKNTKEDFLKAASIYREIDGYKDAASRLVSCEEQLKKIVKKKRNIVVAVSWGILVVLWIVYFALFGFPWS